MSSNNLQQEDVFVPETAESAIRRLMKRYRKERSTNTMSTGERLAVQFVLDRTNPKTTGYTSVLEAVNRLGTEWTAAALKVQREMAGAGELPRRRH